LFAGWRLATIDASTSGGRSADLTLDGWLLGVAVSF
jgi:hypothetical protein